MSGTVGDPRSDIHRTNSETTLRAILLDMAQNGPGVGSVDEMAAWLEARGVRSPVPSAPAEGPWEIERYAAYYVAGGVPHVRWRVQRERRLEKFDTDNEAEARAVCRALNTLEREKPK